MKTQLRLLSLAPGFILLLGELALPSAAAADRAVFADDGQATRKQPASAAEASTGAVKPFCIPALDLSGETERHVIVAQGANDSYKGHPTTYVKYRPGPEKQSVVSVRFKLSEIDDKLRESGQRPNILRDHHGPRPEVVGQRAGSRQAVLIE